jgi:hypothetical protein
MKDLDSDRLPTSRLRPRRSQPPAQPLPPADAGSPSVLLGLQRTAGNAAVVSLLESSGAVARSRTDPTAGRSDIPVQRDHHVPDAWETDKLKERDTDPGQQRQGTPHHYKFFIPLCKKGGECTEQTLHRIRKGDRALTAPYAGTGPVEDGGQAKLPVLGTITQKVDDSTLTITNQTEPDHLLHPGYVRQTVVTRGDDVGVEVEGGGTGRFARLNEMTSLSLWSRVITPTKSRVVKKED